MLVKSLLNRFPSTTGLNASVIEVSRLMHEDGAGAVIVVSSGRLVGIVTDRDVAIALSGHGGCVLTRSVSQVMTPDPFTCFEDQDLAEAAAIMADNQVRRLPATDHDNHLVGLLSLDSIAKDYSEHIAGEILGEIVEQRKCRIS